MLTRSCLPVPAAILACALASTPGYAQTPPSPAPAASAPSSDARPTIGAVAAIGGAALGIAGAVLIATAPAQGRDASEQGAFDGRRGLGAGLLGGGIAFAAIGLPLYLATSGEPLKLHRSEPRM